MPARIAIGLQCTLIPLLCLAQFGDITLDAGKDDESNPQVQCEKWAKQDGVTGTADYELYMEDCLNRFAAPEEEIHIEEPAPEPPSPANAAPATPKNGK